MLEKEKNASDLLKIKGATSCFLMAHSLSTANLPAEAFAFTNVNLIGLAWGYWRGDKSHLWRISCCHAIGSTLSFSLLPFLDPTAYARQRKKHNWSAATFYAGHLCLHVLPCAFIVYHRPPCDVRIFDCVMAHVTQLAWAYGVSGSIYLDNIYVSLDRLTWRRAWYITMLGHYVPLFMQLARVH